MKKFITPILSLFILLTTMISINAITLDDIESINIKSNFASVSEVFNDETRILYQKNADAKMYPASLTKILTTYTAILHGPALDTPVTIQYEDIAGLVEMNASTAGFYEGQELTFKDLLYGSMLPSGADASNAIARIISGSVPAYVELMNQTAKEIGLQSTQFVNTSGLFDENHYTTSNDIALLTKTALQNELFKEIFKTRVYDPQNLTLESTLLLYSQYDEEKIGYIMGGKTGWVDESGYCLSSFADFYGRTYIVVTCDAYDFGENLNDHNLFYKFLFENNHDVTLLNENQSLGTVNLIFQNNPSEYEIINQTAVTKSLPIVIESKDVEITNDFITEIETPVLQGTEIGNLQIHLADEVIYETSYAFSEDIERNNFMYYTTVIKNYLFSRDFIELLVKIVFGIFLLLVGIFLTRTYNIRKNRKNKYKGLKL